jgi:hypothetical protein
MALFFERVSLGPAENVGMILDRYGMDASRWSEVQQLSQNAHIPSSAALTSGPPQIGWLCIPIEDFATVVNYKIARDTVNGLRMFNTAWTPQQKAAYVKSCAHGVEVNVERDGNPCLGLRWLQTVKKRNGVAFSGNISPPEFVDTTTGFPFYNGWNDPDSPDDLTFEDTPCGPAPTRMGSGLDFKATVSLAVWTRPRVTIAFGYTYQFQIAPAGALWIVKPREATDAEYAEQVRILSAGIGEQHQDSGKSLQYRKPPFLGSVNQ